MSISEHHVGSVQRSSPYLHNQTLTAAQPDLCLAGLQTLFPAFYLLLVCQTYQLDPALHLLWLGCAAVCWPSSAFCFEGSFLLALCLAELPMSMLPSRWLARV